MINYSLILSLNYVGKQWSLNGDSYDGLDWLDESPKPTQAELEALWQDTQDQAAKNICKVKAKALLNATDWTQASDCPLLNKAEFATYRATVRDLAINPVADPIFPVQPTNEWSV